MPSAKIAIRHLQHTVEHDDQKLKVDGFRILVEQDSFKWAVYAVMLAEKC